MTPSAGSPHVVIVDSHIYNFGDRFAAERAAWEAQGATVTLAECVSEEDLLAAAHDADVLVYVGLYTPFTANVLSQLPRCRLIARFGIGMDSVDLAAATEQGIVVANAAEYCVPEVADHATALILDLARRITQLDRFVHGGNWAGASAHFGPLVRLNTQTLGLVGFGRIARHVARNLTYIFDHKLAYDPYISQDQADAYGVRLVELDELLAQADYVSIHTPLLPQTRGLIGTSQLAKMKPTAYLVNTSRGPVVDETALIEALQNGQIAGAGLDVFDQEPLADDSPLRTLDNVILTPHMAANSQDAIADIRAAVAETVTRVLHDQWPRHVMNPRVTPRRPLTHVTTG